MVLRKDKNGNHRKYMIWSTQLLPGDVIEITNNLHLTRDVILIYGKCIVTNSTIENGSDIFTKLSIDLDCSPTVDSAKPINVLWQGDVVINTLNKSNECCFGMVINTWYDTI